MADVSSEVRASITTLEQKHSALIDAVRAYTGGSVASAANDLLAESAALQAYVRSQESAMIGIALQQYTGPVPAMVLDFQNDIYMKGTRRLENAYALTQLGDFTRSGDTTVVDGGGVIRVRDSNTVPFSYDPTTGANRGMQVDPTTTNLVPSSNITNTDWDTNESTLQYGKPSPNWLYESVKVIPDNGAAQGQGRISTSYNIPVVAGEIYATSSFVKGDGVTTLELNSWGNRWQYHFIVDLSDGTVTPGNLGTDTSTDRAFIEQYSNGWWRVTVIFAAKTEGFVTLRHCSRNIDENNGSNGFQVWGVQLEEHHTSTNLVPTYGSPVTRTMEHTYFSLGDMYNQATMAASIVVEFWFDPARNVRALDGGNSMLFGFTSDDGTYTPQRKSFAINSEGDLSILWAANTLRFSNQPTQAGFVKVAITSDGDRTWYYLNGERHPSWKDELPLGPMRISVMSDRPGNDALDAPSTYIRSIKYYPFELTQSEAEDLTS